MKIRSKQLFEYLKDAGVLDASAEEIAVVKAAYRRRYKRQWRKRQQLPKKELRPGFTLKQYKDLQLKAHEMGISPTALITQLVLALIESKKFIPGSDQLLTILQLIGMASIELSREIPGSPSTELLQKAERLLIEYLK